MADQSVFETQLKDIINEVNEIINNAEHDDLSDYPDQIIHKLITRSRSAIEQILGKSNAYYFQCEEILKRERTFDGEKLRMILGVIESLLYEIEKGYLKNFEEIIHANMFSDFLEMAEHLLDEGYKDASAVIIGSTLENHLKSLCVKNNISITINPAGGIQNKKADLLNAELSNSNIYNKLDQKNVTAWLDLRNKAAHGNYSDYTKEQVELFLSSIRDFITRHSA